MVTTHADTRFDIEAVDAHQSAPPTRDLDYLNGVAHHIYRPSRVAKLLYWLAFQAPFPYVAKHPALEAARQRRIIADVLTQYWFGHHLIARAIDVESLPGRYGLTTQLVIGSEPERQQRARQFLEQLDARFIEAGLPTSLITPHSNHAIANLIERADGTYRIFDFESSLVSLLYPVSSIVRLTRQGLFPSFDDIDLSRLRAYLTDHATHIRIKLALTTGADDYHALLDAIDKHDAALQAWHARERRYLPKLLQHLVNAVEAPLRWTRQRKPSPSQPSAT